MARRACANRTALAERVIPLRQHAVASGTLMVLDHRTTDVLLAALRRVRKTAPDDVAAATRERGLAVDEKAPSAELTPELLLAQASFIFTSFRLDAAVKAAQGRDCPDIVNIEG